jgi:fructose/tagatose bisphosphate aldolase
MKMTDPMKVNMFVNETKVDLLAVTIGNVHGKYHFPPNLDFLRLNRINQQLSLLPQERRPLLVLHGASGLPEEMITEAINKGIVKFNVNTDLRNASMDYLESSFRGNDKVRLFAFHLSMNDLTFLSCLCLFSIVPLVFVCCMLVGNPLFNERINKRNERNCKRKN